MWNWQHWQGQPYLTCDLLKEWPHGFFTQQFAGQTPEQLVTVLHPEARAYRVKQVHGDRVLTPSEIAAAMTEDANFPPADGVLTETPQQSAWVASADCTPVLIGDTGTGRVAAVHAGWRGTAKRIVPEAIARFLALGSRQENLRVALGPAIAGRVYQVTEDVAAEVGKSLVFGDRKAARAAHSDTILETLHQLPEPPLLADPQPGRIRLDVRRINVLQLEDLGFAREQIAVTEHCTYQQPEYFFSYRRSAEKKVQWSGIVSTAVI
ncbi:peptidoglycan editing factor PgeF [Oscillatoria sp. FACHB-1406]|uniref:peptidoglycan editing factor PgeF n=1 Tax=Oscillatoria sp. FACHB-1406 TaxID=2692846 RepID=UPI001689B20F|nr:peptidoglycan editing factor PgeF [Oscillatoria sp. FACHB-1406]MBD2578977.1 peptidoglycan editing factor PgeF [Oscillatoria sp. FACHB-1406]